MLKNFRRYSQLFVSATVIAGLVVASPAAANNISTTTLVTAGLSGKGADRSASQSPSQSLSYDGTIVVFSSAATNLVPGHSGYFSHVYAYDKKTKKTELISTSVAGNMPDASSFHPTVSADGRYVAYQTEASDIIPGVKQMCGNRPSCINIIVFDRVTKQNTLANVNTLGIRVGTTFDRPPTISANGNLVIFGSDSVVSSADTNGTTDVLVRDLKAKETRVVSVDNSGRTGEKLSEDYSMSGDGRYVAFRTSSPLVLDDKNGIDDIFLRDVRLGITTLVSVGKDGRPLPVGYNYSSEPAISSDGNWVAFASSSDGLVDGDTNNSYDIFLRDIKAGKTQRVSITSSGAQANNSSFLPVVNSDGRYVVFGSFATNLAPADKNERTDLFIHYRDYGITRRVNVGPGGRPAHGGTSLDSSISGDGKTVAFSSDATNLHPGPVETWVYNLYLFHNPVVNIPYFDSSDFGDLFVR